MSEMPVTLAEALAVVLYVRSRDDLFVDEQEVATKAWTIVQAEAERIIREATATKKD
jgi:hypothetical protein